MLLFSGTRAATASSLISAVIANLTDLPHEGPVNGLSTQGPGKRFCSTAWNAASEFGHDFEPPAGALAAARTAGLHPY